MVSKVSFSSMTLVSRMPKFIKSQSQNLSSKALTKQQTQPHEQYILGIQHGNFEPEAGV